MGADVVVNENNFIDPVAMVPWNVVFIVKNVN